VADYSQTHAVPAEGLPAWAGPDGSAAPAANLDPGLDVMLIESRGDWAHVRCSNGWEAWVDGRRLIASAPAATTVPTPTTTAPTPTTTVPTPTPAAPTPTPTAPTPTTAPTPVAPAAATAPSPQAAPPPSAPPTQPQPPSAAWGAPGAATPPPGVPRPTPGFQIGAGPIVALVGGLLYFIASWLSWLHFEFRGTSSVTQSFTAYDIPAHFLLDSRSNAGGLSLGIVIAFFGFACLAAAVLSATNRRLGLLSVVAGGAALLVVVLFLVQTRYIIDALGPTFESGFFSVLRFGVYIALIGAIGSVVGGILTLVQKSS
jgi:hypothetical protein